MLNNCKISQYKIKKILRCFTKDLTAVEASKLTKLNIKTINRYYNIFRKIILQIVLVVLKIRPEHGDFIGYIKGEYGDKCYFKIYKIDEETFVHTKLLEKPKNSNYAIHDKDFNKYLSFLYKRLSKFHGLKGQGYYYQLFESSIKYKYTEEELFNLIWEQLLKTPKF